VFVVVHPPIDFDGLVRLIYAFMLQVFDVFVTLPRSPNEIGVLKVFGRGLTPPIALLDDIFDHLVVVARADVVLLSDLEQLLFFLKPFLLFDQPVLDSLPVVLGHRLELLLVSPECFLFYELVELSIELVLIRFLLLFLNFVLLRLLTLILLLRFLLLLREAILCVVEIRSCFSHG
jgi:hypothetical protein